MARAALAVPAVLLAAAPGGALPAQVAQEQDAELDAGRYEIRSGDRRVGTETFGIRREGGRIRAAGRIVLEGREGRGTFNVALQTGGDFRPTQYVLRAPSGPLTGVDGAWSGDRLRLHLDTSEGERWKEFMTPGPVAVREEGVAHHFYLLFRQLPERPAGSRITLIVPTRNEQATASIQGGTADPVQVGGQRRDATRYEVRVDGETYSVWLDNRGRVLRVESPAEDLTWIRLPGG